MLLLALQRDGKRVEQQYREAGRVSLPGEKKQVRNEYAVEMMINFSCK